MKTKYEVRKWLGGFGTRFTDQREAFNLAKAIALQEECGEAIMNEIVWDDCKNIISYKTVAIRADGTYRWISENQKNDEFLKIGKHYIMTQVHSKDGIQSQFKAKIDSVDDCGDYWYVGYQPEDIKYGRFGFCKVKKNGQYKALNWQFEQYK